MVNLKDLLPDVVWAIVARMVLRATEPMLKPPLAEIGEWLRRGVRSILPAIEPTSAASKAERALQLVSDLLDGGPMEAARVYKVGRERGLSNSAVSHAATKLGVKRQKAGGENLGDRAVFWWSLSD